MEWQGFYLSQLSESKANIFSNSDRISKRRQVCFLLKKYGANLPDITIHKLLYLDDLTDEAMRFCTDNSEIATEDALKIFLNLFTSDK